MGGKSKQRNWVYLTDEKSRVALDFVSGKKPYDHNYLKKLNKFFAFNTIKKRVAIDVGANYGFVSEHLSKQFDEVKSFEVVPDILNCLVENVNGRELNNVIVFPYGLGKDEGEIDIYFNPRYSGHASHFKNIDINDDDPIKCKIQRLDSFGFTGVDFIKIDVEGFELEVLKGGIETIKRNRPVITTEHSLATPESIKSSFAVVELMESLDYQYMRTISSDFIWSPKEYNHFGNY